MLQKQRSLQQGKGERGVGVLKFKRRDTPRMIQGPDAPEPCPYLYLQKGSESQHMPLYLPFYIASFPS